jgi:hypothetical protein
VDAYRLLFLVTPTSLIWCCATGARNPSWWAPPIREVSQEPNWPTLWANWWRSNTNSWGYNYCFFPIYWGSGSKRKPFNHLRM